MNACILAVGSELLTPFRVDTNSLAITEKLNAIGIAVQYKAVVDDDIDRIVDMMKMAAASVDLVVCTGGLGPTEDDLTRDALARVLEAPLEFVESIADRIRERFERRGLTMPAINRRQAMVPRGAAVIENPNGTAPGLWVESGRTAILLLPGPPREMAPMLDAVIRDRLASKTSGTGLFRRVIRITGRTESDVDATAQPVYTPWRTAAVPIVTTILAVLGQIELHLTASAPNRETADRALNSAVQELRTVLGSSVYSVNGEPLEAVVGGLLRQSHWRVAAAESCTGGLLMSRLTDIPGSSDYVDRGVVCYSNQAKTEWLDVPASLIEEHGAVSEPVARAMAEGVRRRASTQIGIGITGIARPGGGTPEKPVGTVAVAVVAEAESRVRTFRFVGGRDMVKFQATQAALNMLRLMLSPD